MACNHKALGHLFGRQVAMRLPVTATTRDVVRRAWAMLKPRHRHAFTDRTDRHRLIKAGIAYITDGRDTYQRVQHGI